MLPIKVGMLVSYDYHCLGNSLPLIYDKADKIVLAIDKNRQTWAGNTMVIPSEFFGWLQSIDIHRKIEVYEDAFYTPELKPIECETRERNMLAKYMGEGGWHIQIDADEYFIDFGDFVDFLHGIERKSGQSVSVRAELVVLYKKVQDGYLLTQGIGEYMHAATTRPEYFLTRRVSNTKEYLYSYRVIHDSWARTEPELWEKLNNWGHKNDFNIDGYFHYWKTIDEKNYIFAKNIHPLSPETWKELSLVPGKNVQELLKYIRQNENLITACRRPSKIVKVLNLCLPPIIPKLYKKLLQKR